MNLDLQSEALRRLDLRLDPSRYSRFEFWI